MSKLTSRAKVSFEHAQSDYLKIYEEDAYMDSCCFHLQQTIEFLLKAIVELNGLRYAENHDIRANLNILNRENISLPQEKELRSKADILYKWETESRYKDSFLAAVKDIEEVMTIAKVLFSHIESMLSERVCVETEFPNHKLSDNHIP